MGCSQGLLIYMDSQSVANLRASAPSGRVVSENASSAPIWSLFVDRCFKKALLWCRVFFRTLQPKMRIFSSYIPNQMCQRNCKKVLKIKKNAQTSPFQALLDSCFPKALLFTPLFCTPRPKMVVSTMLPSYFRTHTFRSQRRKVFFPSQNATVFNLFGTATMSAAAQKLANYIDF